MRTIAPVGSVQQLSVAVLVDGTWKEENGERTFVPRPQEELDRLKELVKSAVGFNEERGDRVEITSAPFQVPETVSEGGVVSTVTRWAPSVLTRLLGVAFVALALLYVVKPLLMTLAQRTLSRGQGVGDAASHLSGLSEMVRQVGQPSRGIGIPLRFQCLADRLVKPLPSRAAQVSSKGLAYQVMGERVGSIAFWPHQLGARCYLHLLLGLLNIQLRQLSQQRWSACPANHRCHPQQRDHGWIQTRKP